MTIEFNATRAEMDRIFKIVDRASRAFPGFQDRMSWAMDLDAVHSNGCPLDFEKLADCDRANFAHDALGIAKHIDRETGKLGGCFVPRCALPEAVETFAHEPALCPSKHWNRGDDICADCGEHLG